MADDKNDAPAGMPGDTLTAGEQAYLDSGGQNTEGLITESAGAAAAATEPLKPSADDTGKPSPDGAAKPGADGKVDAKAEAGADAGEDDDDTPEAGVVIDPTQKQKTVSFYKHERIRKKLAGEADAAKAQAAETARRLAEREEQFARADERLKLLTEALTPKEGAKSDEDPEPDPQKDIFAWIEWSKRDRGRLQEEIRSARQDVGKTQQTIQQRDVADGLKQTFQRDAVAFTQATPDFLHAYNHMFHVRGAMLEDQGYSGDQIRQIVAREERELVQRAVTAGKSPAEMIYQMAQRFGYQKQAAEAGNGAAEPAVEATNGNGAAATAAAKPSVTEEIARIKAGQEAGKTLSGAGGAANELSVAGLLAMSEDEFAALLRKSPGKVNALMGAA